MLSSVARTVTVWALSQAFAAKASASLAVKAAELSGPSSSNPAAAVTVTVTALLGWLSRTTVKVAVLVVSPSATIVSDGWAAVTPAVAGGGAASSSMMVPVAVAGDGNVPLPARLLSVTVKVSLLSA